MADGITIRLDDERFLASLVRWLVHSGQEWPEVLRKGGRLACVSLATATQPYGLGQDSKKQGTAAVAADIKKVYAAARDIYDEIAQKNRDAAKGFWKAFREGDYEKARKVMQGASIREGQLAIQNFDDGARHRSRRNNRGRIGGNNVRHSFVVVKWAEVTKYITIIQKRVGFAKSGWAACARQLGGVRGIPGWVTRNSGPGRVIDSTNHPTQPGLALVNEVKYADKVISQSEVDKAIRIASDRIMKEVDIAISKSARSAGLSVAAAIRSI